MFAFVFYLSDRTSAMVPVSYIYKFDAATYTEGQESKVFWNSALFTMQNKEDTSSMNQLANLKAPPKLSDRCTADGDRYYAALVLRLEDTLDKLIYSINKKRPRIPTYQFKDGSSSGYTDEELFHSEKSKKKEDACHKKKEVDAKKATGVAILKLAQSSRKEVFEMIESEDSDDDPNLIPNTEYEQLKAAYKKLEGKCELLERDLEKLRSLNFQLQERLLILPVSSGERCSELPDEIDTRTEVDLGQNITISTVIYDSLMDLNHVRKFTKSLAVAIWGSDVLAVRSVTGKPCRNTRGPKKVVPGEPNSQVPQQPPPKPPLSPEKLSVISEQMREFLKRKGASAPEIEKELKNRNRYLSDKIQDLRNNKPIL